MFPVGLLFSFFVWPVQSSYTPEYTCQYLGNHAITNRNEHPNFVLACNYLWEGGNSSDVDNCRDMAKEGTANLLRIRRYSNVTDPTLVKNLVNEYCSHVRDYKYAYKSVDGCTILDQILCAAEITMAIVTCGGPEDVPCILAAIMAAARSCLPCICPALGCPSDCPCD